MCACVILLFCCIALSRKKKTRTAEPTCRHCGYWVSGGKVGRLRPPKEVLRFCGKKRLPISVSNRQRCASRLLCTPRRIATANTCLFFEALMQRLHARSSIPNTHCRLAFISLASTTAFPNCPAIHLIFFNLSYNSSGWNPWR